MPNKENGESRTCQYVPLTMPMRGKEDYRRQTAVSGEDRDTPLELMQHEAETVKERHCSVGESRWLQILASK